jgi:V/A-type H+-transporting ATPase subunit K
MVDPNIVTNQDLARGLIAIGAAIAVGLSGYAAANAEASIGAATVGAMAEDEKFFGKGLLMTVIPETIAIFGLVVALILIFVY